MNKSENLFLCKKSFNNDNAQKELDWLFAGSVYCVIESQKMKYLLIYSMNNNLIKVPIAKNYKYKYFKPLFSTNAKEKEKYKKWKQHASKSKKDRKNSKK